MLTIWKFPLALAHEQVIEVPADFRYLDIQVQDGTPCIWAIVNPKREKVRRRIVTVGTGHDLNYEMSLDWYLGTYQVGPFVWHVFDEGRIDPGVQVG